LQAAEKIGILFKEHNAKALGHIADMRHAHQMGMFTFVDKVMACIAENCTCCKAAGRRQCVLKVNTPAIVPTRELPVETGVHGQDVEKMFRTPTAEKAAMVAPALSERDGKCETHPKPAKM
jgi:hypothetical protein